MVCATMRALVTLARWAHLTLALGVLLAVAPRAIGQPPITYIYAALGRLVAVVDPFIEFAPKLGLVGITVTISGTGYSSTPGENSATFNGTPAQVVSATSTEIVTTVPAGASTDMISVTTALGAATSSEAFTVGPPREPTITGFTPMPAERAVSSRDFFVPPAPDTEETHGEDGKAEPEDRSRRLDDPDAGPVMREFIATVAVLAIVVGLPVILLMYGSGLTPRNCREIIDVLANALLRRLRSMIDRENDEPAKWNQTKQCEVGSNQTLMMLTRCFEAQYRSLQPELRALLKRHQADLPFITNRIPAGICARVTALWWTDDVMVRKEQRIFMMVKEDVFLH